MSQVNVTSRLWSSGQFWISLVYVLSFGITCLLAITVLLSVGYELTFKTSIFEWWKSTDNTKVWSSIYLWIIQIIFLKMTELITDLYSHTTEKIISLKVLMCYVFSVLFVLFINSALLIYFTCI